LSKKRGRLFVLSAPSGSGKTTIIETVLKEEPNVVRSVSVTTRLPRAGERDGQDYRFVTERQFAQALMRGEFLESAQILGCRYATPRKPIERVLRKGQDVLLVVDVQGARQIRRSGLPTTTIFLLPPSFGELRERLKRRGTETEAQIQTRLRLARRELMEVRRFDYAVVNARLGEAVSTVKAILRAERYRVLPAPLLRAEG
jgi:guanylate kinase